MLASAGSGGVPDTEGQLECLGSQKLYADFRLLQGPRWGVSAPLIPALFRGQERASRKASQ